ncbi:MAG: hypothetical protein Greene07147_21 [Parcubacteria group bacterium Greene0714_7]|nr:MAG: hypothetical protein Greene07147_21 [Parcubacteria group bacterium Greene0714_7]
MIENLSSPDAVEGAFVVSAGLAGIALAGLASQFPFLARFAKAARDIKREQQVERFQDAARVRRTQEQRADAGVRLIAWQKENGIDVN